MDRLIELPTEDTHDVVAYRREGGIKLGLALARSGCSVEAALILRGRREEWSNSEDADQAVVALKTVAWWNKNWREVAQNMQAGKHDVVLALMGDHIFRLWDQPANLLRLASIARQRGKLPLARHLLTRLQFLCERGVPKTDMTAFRYAASADLADVLAAEGAFEDAINAYSGLTPNPGNAMAHQIQGASLLAQAGRDDAAMAAVAEILLTATAKRAGWSAAVRKDFIEKAEELDRLRKRTDWSVMMADPKGFLKSS